MTTRAATALSLAGYLLGCGLVWLAVALDRPGADSGSAVIAVTALPPTVVLGLLVARRRPVSPVGPALVLLAATPTLAWSFESWWPAAAAAGAWVYNLTGFAVLCLVFPDGPLPGRWRRMPWVVVAVSVAANVELALSYGRGENRNPALLDALVAVLLLLTLGTCVGSLVVRYRHGTKLARTQLRWLVLGAGSVPVLLLVGWLVDTWTDAPTGVAYVGFLAAMLLFLPVTVAVAILRHDLLDIDRLLTESVSWLMTTLLSAAVFAAVVLAVAELGTAIGPGSAAEPSIGVTAAAFVTALVLLPAHRRIQATVGRLLDRERTVTVAALRDFVRAVRDGAVEPESVQDELRRILDDDRLRVLLQAPGEGGWSSLAGEAETVPDRAVVIPLTAQESVIGAIVLARGSARRQRRARQAAVEVRLPIEVSRLRLHLRQALDDARSSRARLVEAATEERRRLERDLHDGAQQRIVAVGMRLRSLQRGHTPEEPLHQELDAAVAALEATVGELRRLAHGVRPALLDDGLAVALRDLVSGSPIPVDVVVLPEVESAAKPATGAGDQAGVEPGGLSEALATTAYFVVAECLANTLKHAAATEAGVTVSRPGGSAVDSVEIEFRDDGCGGAESGSGLRALHDRVSALGGRFVVTSPQGGGTTVRAVI